MKTIIKTVQVPKFDFCPILGQRYVGTESKRIAFQTETQNERVERERRSQKRKLKRALR